MPQPAFNIQNKLITEFHTEKFIAFAREETGLDLRPYNRNSLQRRIAKMLSKFDLQDVGELISYFKGNTHVRELLIENFVVHVTSLFREPTANMALVRNVFTAWRNKPSLKIWMCGCSTGEEVVSMAIMLKEHNLLQRSKILATDLDNPRASRHRELRNIFEELVEANPRYEASGGQLSIFDYFSRFEDKFLMNDNLLERVTFDTFDLIQDEMPEQFDLVWCKNVLIYFDPAYQNKVVAKLCAALNQEGFLALGERESLAFFNARQHFTPLDTNIKLYQLKP